MTTEDGKEQVTFPGPSIPFKYAVMCYNEDHEMQLFDSRGYRVCPICGSDVSIAQIALKNAVYVIKDQK